jgi:uncharacterized hydrophobic protein (TIGR00341 family)
MLWSNYTMALRLIEIFLPSKDEYRVQNALKDHTVLNLWQERFSKDVSHIKILLPTQETEAVLDLLEKHISRVEGYRIILLHVEATLPRIEPAKEDMPVNENTHPDQKPNAKKYRISREELYYEIEKASKLSWIFLILALLSSIVATIGILQNNVAVIIGAMVIAPLLGPNVALSLATTLADADLARRALKANAVGIISALFLAAVAGFMFKIDPAIPEILSRTQVRFGDVVLALAAGSAAVLSFTTGVSSALIGVMVAVALLPPLIVLGMMLGSGHWNLAQGAMLLVLTNVICINLSGVVTFLAQGVRPRKYLEVDRAKKATHIAIVIWTVLLIVLIVAILLSQKS